jgi:hypothetical protein
MVKTKSTDLSSHLKSLNRHLSMENPLLSHLEGMLTRNEEQAASRTYSKDEGNHAKNMLERMYKCYEEGKFCDATLVVGENEIKTHRLVLTLLSEYFNGLFDNNWKDSKQDKIEIKEFDEATLKCILHFAYTGELQLNPSNVLRVLAAGNFLQLFELDFIKVSISDYLKEKVNKDNCPAMLVIAEQFHVVKMKDFLVKYAARNFSGVSQSEDFLELSVELLVEILQSKVLVADHGRDFLPLPTEQEDFILDIVLKYISHQCENEQQTDLLLSKLIHYIRFHCLSPLSLEKLCCYASNPSCSRTLELIKQAKEEIEAEDDELVKLWGTEREGSISKERCCKIHADQVHVGPTQTTFGDESFTHAPHLFIQGMKIWIRLWDTHPVIGGLKVFYSNGESPMYGGDDEDSEVYEFHLGDDERIVKAEVRSGWMVDSLMFFTNKGQGLGPYGGDGGTKYTEEPKGEYGFLSYLKGTVVNAQDKLGIAKLQLIWKEYLVDECDSDGVDIEDDDRDSSISSEICSQYMTYTSESE